MGKAIKRAVAINGSPRMEKGITALVLTAFLQGMVDAGSAVDLFYASRLQVKPCSCGEMYCWSKKPGECCLQDDMQQLYPRLQEADTLILATPVYTPLPGAMQNIINRLCPLIDPSLETRAGRTRARFRPEVKVQKVVLVATSGWWEVANMGTVVRIATELAEDASVEFAGAVLRPHASLMRKQGQPTQDGEAVLQAAKRVGYELVQEGAMRTETLEAVSRPLISAEEWLSRNR